MVFSACVVFLILLLKETHKFPTWLAFIQATRTSAPKDSLLCCRYLFPAKVTYKVCHRLRLSQWPAFKREKSCINKARNCVCVCVCFAGPSLLLSMMVSGRQEQGLEHKRRLQPQHPIALMKERKRTIRCQILYGQHCTVIVPNRRDEELAGRKWWY
jgi:hypothetical protein